MSLPLPARPVEKGLPYPPCLSIDFSPGRSYLIIGPRDIGYLLTSLVADLAETDPVRVVDAGNPLVSSLFHQLTRGRREALDHLQVKRVHSCRSLLSLLEAEPASPMPFILLDLLGPFYAGSILLSIRRETLVACLYQLQRLQVAAIGAVSLSPPAFPLRSARSLFRQVQAEAPRIFSTQLTFPGKSLRSFY